jgi:hypothetical protein
MNLQRFCPNEESCILFKELRWCDMHHIANLEQGDIIYGTANDTYEYSTTTCLSMVKILVPKWGGWHRKLPLFLSRLPNEEKSSFFHYISHRLRHIDAFSWVDDNENYELTDYYITNDYKSKMVCKWTDFTRWLMKSHYGETITFEQCESLYHIGCGSSNFFNLLLNGILPRSILSSFLQSPSNEKIVKNEIYHVVTLQLMQEWIQEFGVKKVWTNLFLCCVRQAVNFEVSDNYGGYRSVLKTPATLAEVKSALEIRDFLMDTNQTERPKCANFPITTRKLKFDLDNIEIFKILIEFYLRSDGSEDLESLNSSDCFDKWIYKKAQSPIDTLCIELQCFN